MIKSNDKFKSRTKQLNRNSNLNKPYVFRKLIVNRLFRNQMIKYISESNGKS